jgi:aspartate/methionine/tyrosine aminotransferase
MTGWRLGYAVWPAGLAEHATRLAINCHSCVNAAAQWAGIAALKGPKDDVAKMMSSFDERRRIIVRELNNLPGFSCVDPSGAFYAFPNISRTGFDAKKLELALLEEVGVAVIAGTSFGAHGEGFIRFSYANSVENILAACDRIRNWLHQRKVA